MSLYPDMLPPNDGLNDIGTELIRWNIFYAMYLSDGNGVVIPVRDLATVADVAAMSALPLVTAADDGRLLTVQNSKWGISAAPMGTLPLVSTADNDKYLVVRRGRWVAAYAPVLPPATVEDNGMMLKVVDGEWRKSEPPPSLPNVTVSDDGKILTVVNGKWQAASPPADVLPPVTEVDHGSVLVAGVDRWVAERVGLATEVAEGFVPRRPGVAGRVLKGNNTWGAVSYGSSGQWRIGDRITTYRPQEAGWLAHGDGNITPGPDKLAYQALYFVLGGTQEMWDNGTPVALPVMGANEYIRYLPNTQANVQFGIMLDVEGSDEPGDRLAFEVEIFRNFYDDSPVLSLNTLFQVHTNLEFQDGINSISSSSPGFFWWDTDHWRLVQAAGEVCGTAEKRQVLFDVAEASRSNVKLQTLHPGSYFYRYRQIIIREPLQLMSEWRWGRVLSTGGLNEEESQLFKVCDIFAVGRPQEWRPPMISARMYSVSAEGMKELEVLDDDSVVCADGSGPGTLVSLVGHGYSRANNKTVDPLNFWGVVPQYTARKTEPAEPTISRIAETATLYNGVATVLANLYNCRAIIPAVPAADGAPRYNAVLSSGQHMVSYNQDTGTLGYSGGTLAVSEDDYLYTGYTEPEKVGAQASRDWGMIVPPRESDSTQNVYNATTQRITHPEVASWMRPMFNHQFFLEGCMFLFPGEAPGVYDLTNQQLIPLPEGTVFRGSAAGCVGPDGCVYILPRFTWADLDNTRSTGMLRFDPRTRSISFIPVPWELGQIKDDWSGWYNANLLRDGRILFTPRGEADFVVFDVRYKTLQRTTFGVSLPAGNKFIRTAVANDGSVMAFGTDITGYTSLCFRFNPEGSSLRLFTFPVPLERACRALTAMKNGDLLLATMEGQPPGGLYKVTCGKQITTPGVGNPFVNRY